MAKTFNPMLQDMSGKLGGYVVCRSAHGAILRGRPAPAQTISERQSGERGRVSRAAEAWRDAGPEGQAAWGALARVTPDLEGVRGGRTLAGYTLFQQVCAARAAQGLPPPETVPRVPAFPPFLEVPTVTATADADGFHVVLSGVEYPCAVQVFAWRKLPVGDTRDGTERPALLVTLPGLSASGADVGAVYAARHEPVAAGWQISVRLVGLSPEGFRCPAVTAHGVVTR